jgi:hypothetical protein
MHKLTVLNGAQPAAFATNDEPTLVDKTPARRVSSIDRKQDLSRLKLAPLHGSGPLHLILKKKARHP